MMMLWKPIPGFEDYGFVSSTGIVKRKDGLIRKSNVGNTGYLRVGLNSGKETLTVHRLVALAFVDGYKDGLVVNHKDGNKLNNNIDNLEWVTQSENALHGFHVLNRKHPRGNMILDDDTFNLILERMENGEKQAHLAKEYGVSPAAICKRKKELKVELNKSK